MKPLLDGEHNWGSFVKEKFLLSCDFVIEGSILDSYLLVIFFIPTSLVVRISSFKVNK